YSPLMQTLQGKFHRYTVCLLFCYKHLRSKILGARLNKFRPNDATVLNAHARTHARTHTHTDTHTHTHTQTPPQTHRNGQKWERKNVFITPSWDKCLVVWEKVLGGNGREGGSERYKR